MRVEFYYFWPFLYLIVPACVSDISTKRKGGVENPV